MHFNTLDQWLQWQMDLHGQAIDLGLERVRAVGDRLGLERIAGRVITVAGTNGKGSSVAAYECWLRRSGYSVASYTSPHLLRYNERIKNNLQPASDDELCAAFAAVEAARAETSLTYFEFGTLAALQLMQGWQPDYALLEVGLGGRLDAVNIVDADLVHLTPIGIDHQAFLGDDREQIGFEKAGVLRRACKVVLNDPDPPHSVLTEIERLDCRCLRYGRDYDLTRIDGGEFIWRGGEREIRLDNPLPGDHQQRNLAGVMAGLSMLIELDDYEPAALRENFHGMQVAGRFQQLESALGCRLFADVGHNPDAAAVLVEAVSAAARPGGRVVVLLGMLEDKQAELFTAILDPVVDEWWLLSLHCDRGQSAARLQARIGEPARNALLFDDIAAALDRALSSLSDQDIMLVTGSFVSIELLLRALPESDELEKHGSKH